MRVSSKISNSMTVSGRPQITQSQVRMSPATGVAETPVVGFFVSLENSVNSLFLAKLSKNSFSPLSVCRLRERAIARSISSLYWACQDGFSREGGQRESSLFSNRVLPVYGQSDIVGHL